MSAMIDDPSDDPLEEARRNVVASNAKVKALETEIAAERDEVRARARAAARAADRATGLNVDGDELAEASRSSRVAEERLRRAERDVRVERIRNQINGGA